MTHLEPIVAAVLRGDWDAVHAAASDWIATLGAQHDPLPHFAVNAVSLIRGDFKSAWAAHAKSLQEEGDIAAVRTWVDDLLQRHGDRATVQLLAGLCLSQSGQSDASMGRYKDAIRLEPTSPAAAHAHYFLGQIYERLDRMEVAIKEYREAVKLNPAYAPARTNLGVAYQQQGQLEMAIPQYREVLKLNPDSVAHANLACALAEQGKIEPALVAYREAIRLSPNDAELHFALGGVLETKGRMDLALKEYETAIAVDEAFAPPYTALGWYHFNRNARLEAYGWFNKALKHDPNNASAYFGLGRSKPAAASRSLRPIISRRRSNTRGIRKSEARS